MLAASHLFQGRKHSNSRARSAQLGERLFCDAVRNPHARECLLRNRKSHVLLFCNSLQSSLACKAKQRAELGEEEKPHVVVPHTLPAASRAAAWWYFSATVCIL